MRPPRAIRPRRTIDRSCDEEIAAVDRSADAATFGVVAGVGEIRRQRLLLMDELAMVPAVFTASTAVASDSAGVDASAVSTRRWSYEDPMLRTSSMKTGVVAGDAALLRDLGEDHRAVVIRIHGAQRVEHGAGHAGADAADSSTAVSVRRWS